MTRLLISIFLLIASLALVFYFGDIMRNGSSAVWAQSLLLNGTDKGITGLKAQEASLNQALVNARTLKTKINGLSLIEKSIPTTDRERLDKFIPDSIENINLIIDVNTIAVRNGMVIKDVQFKTTSNEKAISDIADKANSSLRIAETSISFSVTGDYQSFANFLAGLADSIRVTDVSALSFKVDEKGINQYNFEVKTYWVK